MTNTILLLAPDRASQSLFGTALQMAGFQVEAGDSAQHVRASLRTGRTHAAVVEHPVPDLLTPGLTEALAMLSASALPTVHLIPAAGEPSLVVPPAPHQLVARLPVRPATVVEMLEKLLVAAA